MHDYFLGAHNRYNDGTEYKISKIILHQDYSHVFNDMALLKLEKPAVLNDKVGTICLPKQGDRLQPAKMCWMTGEYTGIPLFVLTIAPETQQLYS